jgi:outer membrane receptor for ferrienterochelin and colicins
MVAAVSYGQGGKISGYVFDDENILPFANVVLHELDINQIADAEGFFIIDNLPNGDYTVTVSYLGYKKNKQKISISDGSAIELKIQMRPENIVEEIVITGTMKPVYVSASPIKVEVITAKQLDTYIPGAASSLVESVSLVNGVQEVVACGVCFTNSISINGLHGAYTSILMDGTPMYGNLASVYGLNGIPNMIIDRFEVIKGPSSTLYGSEAVAGVINIITKDPAKQPLISTDIMYSSHQEVFGNLSYAQKMGKSSAYIGLNFAKLPRFEDDNNDGFSDGALMDRYSVFTKWNIARNSGKHFSVSAKYYFEDRRNGVEAFLIDNAYKDLRGSDEVYGESIITKRLEIFGSYVFDVPFSLKLDFSASHHLQDSYYGADYYEASQGIIFSNLIYNLEHKAHDILLGFSSRLNAYNDNTLATESMSPDGTIIDRPDNQYIPGFFVQDEYSFSDKIKFLNGLRLDYYSDHGYIFSPRMNMKYSPSDWTTFRLNFGTGFRVVNLFTEDHAFISGQRVVQINEELQPEESYNLSLNYNHVYSGFGGMGSIDVESYYTHFTNKIIPDYSDPQKIIYQNSQGYAITKGIGVSVNHNFEFPLSLNWGLNIQRAEEYLGVGEEGRPIEFAPEWSMVLAANFETKKPAIVIAYSADFTGPMALPEVYDLTTEGEVSNVPRSTISQPFAIHNLQITSKRKIFGMTIYGGVQNFLNMRQKQSPLVGYNDPNYDIGFSPYFDTSYSFAPNHGREVYLGIKWNFE